MTSVHRLSVAVLACLMLLAASANGTIFKYTGNPLSDGGRITASVTLACQSCPPGTYGSAAMLALSVSYGSTTFSWPPGNGAPTDPWITLNSSGEVVEWQLLIQNDIPFPPYANFILQTVNTTDPRYQHLRTADGDITGGIFDAVLFRQPPVGDLRILESNVASPGTWVTVNRQTNHPPLPVVTVEDNLGSSEYPTLAIVLAPDGLSAEVVFDGSASSDPDGDVLYFSWGEFDEGRFHPFGEGVRVSSVFRAESAYNLGLVVNDGITSVVTRFTLYVWTPAMAVGALMDAVTDEAQPDGKPRQSLLGPLEEALTAFENGDNNRAIHFLRVFQRKARVQTVTSDPERAEEVDRITRILLDKVK